MKKTLCCLIALLCACAMALAGCGSQNASPAPAPASSDDANASDEFIIPFTVTIDPPEGWTEEEATGIFTLLVYVSKNEQVSMSVFASKAQKSVDEVIDTLIADTEKNNLSAAFDEPVDVTVDGHAGKSIQYTYMPTANFQVFTREIVVILDEWKFSIVFSSYDADAFHQNADAISDMLASMKILPD